ncbi:MAG: MCE family protein [Deltaproteobacteria bacterium]|nr:MAG: MCE family protein [Deltaproteobacteria bacterium]
MATTATNHWKLGLFVLVGVGATVGSLFWLGARRFQRESFPAVSYFDESVQGLDVGSPVKFRGVTVGTVADITIGPDHRHVQITSDIYVDALVRLGLRTRAPRSGEEFIDPRLRVQLASAGITGVRFIQTDFFDPERFPPPRLPFEPPWNYVPSAPSTLKSAEEAAIDILNRLPVLADRAKDTLADVKKTLASIDRFAADLGAEDGSFNRALQELRSVATRVDRALDEAQLGATAASFRDTAVSVGQAAAGVSDAQEELQASLVALREALESVRSLADSLERDPSVLLRGRHGDGASPARRR